MTEQGPSITTLDRLKIGHRGIVKSVVALDKTLKRRLLSMGLVAGSIIEVLRVAPLGDPIKISALGYKLSLRISEAREILVQEIK